MNLIKSRLKHLINIQFLEFLEKTLSLLIRFTINSPFTEHFVVKIKNIGQFSSRADRKLL